MKTTVLMTAVLFMLIVGGASLVEGQDQRAVKKLDRFENLTAKFSSSLNAALDANKFDEKQVEYDYRVRIRSLETAALDLRRRAEAGSVELADVENLLGRGLSIEMIMQSYPVSALAQNDWAGVREILNSLAQRCKIGWVWMADKNPYWRRVSRGIVFERLEKHAGEFRASLKETLSAGGLHDGAAAGALMTLAKGFEKKTDRLERQVKRGEELRPLDIKSVLYNARIIDNHLKNQNISQAARRDWAEVRMSLDEAAMLDNIVWRWTADAAR